MALAVTVFVGNGLQQYARRYLRSSIGACETFQRVPKWKAANEQVKGIRTTLFWAALDSNPHDFSYPTTLPICTSFSPHRFL